MIICIMIQKMELKKMSDQPRQYKESDEFFEGEQCEGQGIQNERDEYGEERLRKRREWLRSLTQEDRNFIAKYGEELWESWKARSEKNGGKEKQTS